MKMNHMSFYSLIARLRPERFLGTRLIFVIDLIVAVCSSGFALLFMYLLLSGHVAGSRFTIVWFLSSFAASLISIRLMGAYRQVIRYSTLREMWRLTLVSLFKELLMLTSMCVFFTPMMSGRLIWGLLLLDLLITACLLVLVRICMVVIYDVINQRSQERRKTRRVLIFGVGDKEAAMVTRLANSPHFMPVGFLTEGKGAKDHRLAGLPVYYFSDASSMKALARKTDIDGVLFARIDDARRQQENLVAYCQEADIKSYVAPKIDEIEDGRLGTYIRHIKIEDLLGRSEIQISMDEIRAQFSGKVILVTGAAGSIGSELCRQLASFGVKRLIIFDNAETPLHNIRLELEDTRPDLDFVPVIGDVRSEKRLDFVFRHYRPQVVFHAAAYKHVPLMEENPCEAVRVNVAGSRMVADKCVEYDVEKMVMVSTDKAVNPTNVMGCTKRLAEIYVQSLGLAIERGEVKGRTRFITTRFGNVLGSNGSVIPRFREQIEKGGPVTVTDPEIRRFFMTIPEACRLVMEAATFATGTQIFVFDMGESVKIADLARRMIRLAGLEEGRDISISYTGLRPGEKLYEEVLASKENTMPTPHERIFVAKVREYDYSDADRAVNKLNAYAESVTISEMVKLMKKVVPEFISKHSPYEIYDNPEAGKPDIE